MMLQVIKSNKSQFVVLVNVPGKTYENQVMIVMCYTVLLSSSSILIIVVHLLERIKYLDIYIYTIFIKLKFM